MTLQNRVTAFGEIVADPARGQIFGNRGGRIHNRDKALGNRRWASKAWIICALEFKQRRRTLMAPNSYTELFFLDEVTALAAGHRPCFECRRTAAIDFAEKWGELDGRKDRARAGEMDNILHVQRVQTQTTRIYPHKDVSSLPDGAMILWHGQPAALRSEKILPWTMAGYGLPVERPIGREVAVLTPAKTVEILAAGYQPVFHVDVEN